MNAQDTITIITAVTALIGTAGGLFLSYKSLQYSLEKDRTKVNIRINKASMGLTVPSSTNLEWSEDMLTMKLANVGNQDFVVTLVGVNIGRRTGHLVIPIPKGTVPIPYSLKPNETCNFWTSFENIEDLIKKKTSRSKISITVYAQDYIGNVFTSNKLEIRFRETKIYLLKQKIIRTARYIARFFFP